MKVFTNKEFVEKLKWLVYEVPNYYYSKIGSWCNYDTLRHKFSMDCVVSIKGLLWGFKADKNKLHGGGVYLANGVEDFGANAGINYCTDASQDFSKLIVGEYLCMKGTHNDHAGIYLGDDNVFECTTGWGANRCIISKIDKYGNRSYNGRTGAKWTWHGKLNYINYTQVFPQPVEKTNEEIAKEVIQGKWGNGEDRKRRLTNAGYNYKEIQKIVNELLK